MTDVFETIKDRLNIKDVADYYGIKINKNNKALCVFHNDKHPSLSFKDNFFHCFSCGTKGSVLDLVMKLFNLDVLQATKKLNDDFSLNLFPESLSDVRKNQHNLKIYHELHKQENFKLIIKHFKSWQNDRETILIKFFKIFTDAIKTLSPQEDKKPLEIWVLAVHNIELTEYYLDILQFKDDFVKVKNYKDIDLYIKKLIFKLNKITKGDNI